MSVTVRSPYCTFEYAGARLNIYNLNKGEGLPRHEHGYNHAMVCIVGSVVVRKEGKEKVMTKSSEPIDLISGEWHEIEAIEDGTIIETVFINTFTY